MVQHTSCWTVSFLLVVGYVSAFTSTSYSLSSSTLCNTRKSNPQQYVPFMSVMDHENDSSTTSTYTTKEEENSHHRRSFIQQMIQSSTTAFVVIAGSTILGYPPQPAHALGGGLSKVNAKLTAYGLPTIPKVQDNFVPLLEVYGKGKNRDAILVQFTHPIDWVVTLPSQDVNGEDGTIQAGEYAKGDTATFFVYSTLGKVENLENQDKEFFAKALSKAISLKGDNVYQNFKITNVAFSQVQDYKNQVYAIVDFKYQLLTGAGFEIDRVGVASVTSVGNAVQVLWTASTRPRYKKTEEILRTIASSFRCYTDGLDLLKTSYTNVV